MHSKTLVCTMIMGRVYLQIPSENFGEDFTGYFDKPDLNPVCFLYEN